MPQLPEGTQEIDSGTMEFRTTPGEPYSVTIYVNWVPSSHLFLDNHAVLEFEYMQWIAAFLDRMRPSTETLRALHLGGAGCTLAAYIDATRPNSRQLAVEIDARLAQLVREHLNLPRAPRLRIRVAEAREATASLWPGSRDVVIRDVFSGIETPEHLRTVEFLRLSHSALADDGLYIANCGYRLPSSELNSELASTREVFGYTALVVDPSQLNRGRYGNQLIVASDNPDFLSKTDDHGVDVARALRSAPLPARILTGADLVRYIDAAPTLHDPASSFEDDADSESPDADKAQ